MSHFIVTSLRKLFHLFLVANDIGEIGQCFFALEPRILDNTCISHQPRLLRSKQPHDMIIGHVPASASEEKCADHCTNVDPSHGPVVTA